MKMIVGATLAALLLSCGSASVSETSEDLAFEIPSRFWGEYSGKLSDCGTGTDDTRIRISSDTVQFYESTGELKEIIHHKNGDVTLLAEHSGEGQTWNSLYALSLLEGSKKLVIMHSQDAEMGQVVSTRNRC